MKHARSNIWNKNLPRAFGIFVLVFSLTTIFWLSRNVVLLGSKAALSNIPRDVRISNISSSTFTVSYVTSENASGSLSYGKDAKLGSVAFDLRDTASPAPHYIHYITVKSLSPSTKYLFAIVSGDAIFQKDSVPYEVTTANNITASSSAQASVSGSVKLENGNAPPEAITYVFSDDSQLLSSIVKPDGSYSLNLDNLLKKDLLSPLNLSPDTPLRMNVIDQSLQSHISFLIGHANPLPPIILSRDYDFSLSTEPLASSSASGSAEITGFPPVEESSSSASPRIITPKTAQEFKDQQPTFQGTALPNTEVEITIQSAQEINTTVQSDSNGAWEFRPDTPLEPGQHTLTIKTLDASGVLKTITQSFTVFAEGSQFIEPSISPTQPITPSPAPTVTIPPPTQQVPSPTPTSKPSPSPTVASASPTLSPPPATPTPQITTPPIPKSGSNSLIASIIGIVSVIGIGGLIFFLI